MKNRYIKLALTLLVALFIQSQAWAIPAYPGKIQVTQPDGSRLTIKMHGDEFFGYATLENGSLITQKDDGFYYYASMVGDKIVASAQKASSTGAMLSRGSGVIPAQAAFIASRRREQRMRDNSQIPRADFSLATKAGERKSLIIMVQYEDVKFTTANVTTAFNNMLNQSGYSVNGATGSAKDFYRDNSMGVFNPNFVVSVVVTLSEKMAYYGANIDGIRGNDIRPREMVIEACHLAKAAGVNFADYDYDNRGIVDDVFVYYAGGNEAEGASANTIWPHRWSVAGMNNTFIDGKRLAGYACSSGINSSGFMAGIGTFCHEFGHVLGLPDFYDADYEAHGLTPGLGSVATMSKGAYNNAGRTPPYFTAIEREFTGWLKPTQLVEQGDYNLAQIQTNVAYRVESGNPDEYFLIEARGNTGWDKYIPGSGMVITHVDKSQNRVEEFTAAQLWTKNALNCYLVHMCTYFKSTGSSITREDDWFFPGRNNVTHFNNSNGFKSWSGRAIPQAMNSITETGSGVSFKLTIPTNSSILGKVVSTNGQPLAGVDLTFTEINQTKSSSGLFRTLLPLDNTKAGKSYSVTTDQKGEFKVDDIAKDKDLAYVATKDGYVNQIGQLKIDNGENILNIQMQTIAESKLRTLSWSGDLASSISSGTKTFYIGAAWKSQDLKEYVGGVLKEITFHCSAVVDARVSVMLNGKEILSKNLNGLSIAYKRVTIDISQANITIGEKDELKLIICYSNIPGNAYPMSIDNRPAVVGKGDLFSFDGIKWDVLSSQGFNNNWVMGFRVSMDDKEEVPVTPFQTDVLFDLTKMNPDSKETSVSVTELGGSTIDVKGAQKYFVVGGLKPGTSYTYEILVSGGKSATGSFKTSEKKYGYAAIADLKRRYKSGDIFPLAALNLGADVKEVKWYIDGVERNNFDRGFILTKSCQIRADVTMQSGEIETIIREIVLE